MRFLLVLFVTVLFLGFGNLSAADDSKNKSAKYKKQGISYAIDLYNPETNDEVYRAKNRKADLFAYKLRNRAIRKSLAFIKRVRDSRIKNKVLKKLAELYDKQTTAEDNLFSDKRKARRFINRSILVREGLLKRKLDAEDRVAVMLGLAANYISANREEEGGRLYGAVYKEHPNSGFADDALIALGNIYYIKKDFPRSRSYYSKILKLKNKTLHGYAKYKIAWTYFNQKKTQLALDEMKSVVQFYASSKRADGFLEVIEEAVRDIILFYAEVGAPEKSKAFFASLLLGEKKSFEARYRLARQYFAYDNHRAVRIVTTSLLKEKPPTLYRKDLLMMSLHVAEKTENPNRAIYYSYQLGEWVKNVRRGAKRKLTDAEKTAIANVGVVIEDLFFHAYQNARNRNNLKDYLVAIKIYEIHKGAFNESKLPPDVYYHYANVLRKSKKNVNAYKVVSKLIKEFDTKDKRFKNVLKLRIQIIEEASPSQRIILSNKRLIVAYNSFVKHYPDEKLSQDALFKSAQLLEEEGMEEKAAFQYEMLIKKYPNSRLRKLAALKMMQALSKTKNWDQLEKRAISIAENAKKLTKDRKISSVLGLSLLAVAESHEKRKDYDRVKEVYLKFIDLRKNSPLRVTAYLKLLNMLENKQGDYEAAVKYWRKFQEEHPSDKLSQNALLEEARIYEKFMRPKKAVEAYLEYAETGNLKLHRDALSNAAVLSESIGDWEAAADTFLLLSDRASNSKEKLEALQFSCTDRLLDIGKSGKSGSRLKKLVGCASALAEKMLQPISSIWKVRAAWALEHLDEKEKALAYWKEVRQVKRILEKTEMYQVFIALADSKFLEIEAEKFKRIKFSKDSDHSKVLKENMQQLTKIEKLVKSIVELGTRKQVQASVEVLYDVYMNLSEKLLIDNLPEKLSEQERETIKKGYAKVATKMEEKADALMKSRNIAVGTEELEEKEKEYTSLDREAFQEQLLRAVKQSDVVAYGTLARHHFAKRDYDIARFIYLKWGQLLTKSKKSEKGAILDYGEFGKQIALKIPEKDPIVLEIL